MIVIGTAIPASSGSTIRYRLDRGGNRQWSSPGFEDT
jgi:hypothetical protein